ncbi:efflux RND transporter periplasmic adaptor subunit [Nannocystaceae bacterium ST9]
MTTRSRWRLAVVVVALLGVVALALWLLLRGPRVEVVRPTRGGVTETVVSSGRVLPPAEINLGALVNSTVREVHVGEGDPVQVGELLVQLEDAELVAALSQAEATLEQAKAGRFELTKLSEPAARANLREAEATLADAKRNLARTKQLYESSFGTRADYEDAQTAHSLAKAQQQAARLQLAATGEGGSQALLSSAGIAVATAQVERAKAQLSRTRIESPVDGIVLDRYLEPGDSVVAGSKMLLISRTGLTRLVIEPDERNLARLALGQQAFASAEAFPSERFAAEVQYIAPSVDPQRGTIEVHLAVPDPPDYLRPHMTISVEVIVGVHEDTLLVPRKALRGLASDAPFVLAVEGGRAVQRPVEVGIRGDERVELLSGLADDAWVIRDETLVVESGDRVRAERIE